LPCCRRLAPRSRDRIPQDPAERDQACAALRDAGLTPQQGLRLRGTDAEERGLPEATMPPCSPPWWLSPLIERPLVETDKGVRLCRPKEKVAEIL
jgi:arsenate reductase